MNRTSVEFLRTQLLKSVAKLTCSDTYSITTNQDFKLNFKIQFDKDEVQEPKTNMDEIMYYHAIPNLANKILTLDEVCDMLVPGTNEIPLWIKLNLSEGDEFFTLIISKRFRKKKVVQDWHGDNDLLPVIINNAIKPNVEASA